MEEIIAKPDFIKIKNFCSVKLPQETKKTSHRMGGKYLQKTYLIKDCYPNYIKNS